jgi:hypothetical protein
MDQQQRLKLYLPKRIQRVYEDALCHSIRTNTPDSLLLPLLRERMDELEQAVIRCKLLGINPRDRAAINNLDDIFGQCLARDVIVIHLQALHSTTTDAYKKAREECQKHVEASSHLLRRDEKYYIDKKALQRERERACNDMSKVAVKCISYCREKSRMFDDIVQLLEEAKTVKIAQGLNGCDSISEYEPPTYEHAEIHWMFLPVLVKLTLVRGA